MNTKMKMKKKTHSIRLSHFQILRQLKVYILKKLKCNMLRLNNQLKHSLKFQNPLLDAGLDAYKSSSLRRLIISLSMHLNNQLQKIPEMLRSLTIRKRVSFNADRALVSSTNVITNPRIRIFLVDDLILNGKIL